MNRAMSSVNLEDYRKTLRFGLNDRVICNLGERWASGIIVGTAVDDDDGIIPYLAKLDAMPGCSERRTISVPYDEDEVCVQEVCFQGDQQLHWVKASTPIVSPNKRSSLRFAAGDKVVCRLKNS